MSCEGPISYWIEQIKRGNSNEEIAQRMRRSVRTVERPLQLIRGKWEKEMSA
jgi:DNA-binding NarL/FixJ family response regulator